MVPLVDKLYMQIEDRDETITKLTEMLEKVTEGLEERNERGRGFMEEIDIEPQQDLIESEALVSRATALLKSFG